MDIIENKNLYCVCGRHTYQDGILYLAYSAAYVEFDFYGGSVEAELVSDGYCDEENLRAWAAVFVDGGNIPVSRFALKKGRNKYIIYENGDKAQHRVRIMKYSEAAFATMGICSIEIFDGKPMEYVKTDRRLIEFVGDSITCGYGIEGIFGKDEFKTSQENPWNAYACKTAVGLGCDFELVSWSGDGIISSWVDESVNEPKLDTPLLPELYKYADLELERRLGRETYTLWKPERKPDIIVINLGTNDASYTRQIPEREKIFIGAYRDFLVQIRRSNPNARIICMLGIMDRRLNGAVAEAVKLFKAANDENISFIDQQVQDEKDGLGTDSHPSVITHDKMAKNLIDCICERL